MAATTATATPHSSPTMKSYQKLRSWGGRPSRRLSRGDRARAPHATATGHADDEGDEHDGDASPPGHSTPAPSRPRTSRTTSASPRRRTSACSPGPVEGAWTVHRDAQDDDQRAAAPAPQREVVLGAAEGHDDERHLEAFEEHALEGTVKAYQSVAAPGAGGPSRRVLGSKIASSSWSAIRPLARRIALRSHCSPKIRSRPPITRRNVSIGSRRAPGRARRR